MNKVLKIHSLGRDSGLGCSHVEEALPVVAKSLRNVHSEKDIDMQVTIGKQYAWNVWKHFPEDGPDSNTPNDQNIFINVCLTSKSNGNWEKKVWLRISTWNSRFTMVHYMNQESRDYEGVDIQPALDWFFEKVSGLCK